jgi:hypothetical protein
MTQSDGEIPLTHQMVAQHYDDIYYTNATVPSFPSRHLRQLVRRVGIAEEQQVQVFFLCTRNL